MEYTDLTIMGIEGYTSVVAEDPHRKMGEEMSSVEVRQVTDAKVEHWRIYDLLAKLRSSGSIDEAQYQGGRSFQRDFDLVGKSIGVDPTKELSHGGTQGFPTSR